MSSRAITVVAAGKSRDFDCNGHIQLFPSGLKQPQKLWVEEDGESGIGSTLDLSSSFESSRQHTNTLFSSS
ncbi:unnamed protein product [Knipowitschia caucasica]|uniref:Uncharacterized protein n=1 Tax=Knipowitschia caucasica TaxID=637954 RepID=A0AAV2MJ28_KNICA